MERCKTITKVIATANQNKEQFQNEPIKTPSKYASSAGKPSNKVTTGFRFASDWLRKSANFLNQSHGVVKQNQCNPGLLSTLN